MSDKFAHNFGWIPDYPDFRDYTDQSDNIKLMFSTSSIKKAKGKLNTKVVRAENPSSIDLRKWCSPIENQGSLGSCTAHAVAGVVEYFELKAFGKHIDASRLFLYKTTRNLMHLNGDTGAFLKTALGALVLFGMPPEEFCPYETEKFDEEPSAFCYAFAQNYQCINYFRHDPSGKAPGEVLAGIKEYLVSGIPSIFGFTVYNSISDADTNGKIPFPSKREKILGGHAVAAFGYDDKIEISNPYSGLKTKGALLIRNSWGKEWGEHGYGWLPYEYVLQGIALDFWSVIKQEWVDTGLFSQS